MSKLHTLISHYVSGKPKRHIALSIGVSRNTVDNYLGFLKAEVGEDLSPLLSWDEEALYRLVNHRVNPTTQQILNDLFPTYEQELSKVGMTRLILWERYCLKHSLAVSYSRFCHYLREWQSSQKVSMHLEHKAGDKLFIDFAGKKLFLTDPQTGEITWVEVFLAVLGCSQLTYCQAVYSQKKADFLLALANSLTFFGGVTQAIVPDNLKSAVNKASSYEPTVNENFKAFADHYGVAILPARSRKPQDKAHVENMVKLSYQKIYANLPEKDLAPLPELNKQIWQHLVTLNDALLTGKERSRTDQWLMELSSLQPLPATWYEMRKIKQVTVMKNGHVYLTEDQHYYSVPYELIGKKLKMQYSRSEVNMYLHYELIVTHKRLRSPHNYTTITEHMPAQHRYVMEWNPSFFMTKAKEIDPIVEYYISQVLARKQHPEQGYKSCMGILSFAKRLGEARLIRACKRAHEIGYYNYKIIEDILKQNLDKYDDDDMELSKMPVHDNIRGGNYYE